MRRPLRFAVAAITTVLLFFVTAVPAWAMTLTFVRHAESQANADGVIDTSVPGPGLSPLGQQQAQDVAQVLAGNGYDGIYVSSMLRTQQTAQPLLDLLPAGTEFTVLPGLREISAGVFEGASEDEGLGRLGYALAPIAWTLGARFVPVLGAEDGNAFDARVDGAIQQIYDSGDENAVAFSHGATIMFWVMMNVENPDLGLLLSHQLDNTEAVVIEGSPEEGWTLVSWAGIPVAAEPSLPTKLFVNVRNLVVAPQTALYDIGQAFATGDIGALAEAVRDGVVNVARTVIGFVPEMVKDVVESVGDSLPSIPMTVQESAKAADPAGSESESEPESEPDTMEPAVKTVTTKKRVTTTDLTDGNKVRPGDTVAENSAEDVTEDTTEDTTEDVVEDATEKVTEDVNENTTEPTQSADNADASDDGDNDNAESGSTGSAQNAA